MVDIEELKKEKTIKELLEFGILNIDKSSGPTSFNISDYVRKKLNLRKTSHFGTLDPKVTGVLPIGLNRGCKLTGFFLGEDKEYVGIMRFHKEVNQKEVEEIIKKKFLGEITQLPPLKSRVKRQERQREIKEFVILEQETTDFLFRVVCQGGTYIRKLIDDLGKEMNISAHMLELRRTRAGIFLEDDKKYPSIKLYDFKKAVEEYKNGEEKLLREMIIPGEIVSKLHKTFEIKSGEKKRLLTGKPLYRKDLVKEEKLEKEEIICIFDKNEFVGIYKVINGEDILAKPDFVFQIIG